jgi:hypothetical protein
LLRGDTYYLADGTYPVYSFSTPGTTLTVIKKAKSTDHCTDAGWNAGTMGNSQAIFATTGAAAPFSASAGNFTLDGNGTSTKAGCGAFSDNGSGTSDCGIKLDMSACFNGSAHDCYGLSTSNSPANITLRYVEVKGTGDAANGTDNDQCVRLIGVTNFLGFHIYVHDSSAVSMTQVGGSNNTLDHSAFWKNRDSSAGHGQGIQDGPGSASGLTLSYNIFKDIEGQGAIAALNSGTASNYNIYGNVFYRCENNCNSRNGLTNGMITCINPGRVCSNWQVYDNTFVGNPNGNGVVLNDSSTGSLNVRNNLWYANTGTATLNLGGSSTEDYNSFLNGPVSGNNGTHDMVVANGSPNPFNGWPTDPGVFTLGSDGTNWDNRVLVGAPFDTDAAGNAFTTDRGAYQFVSLGSRPAAPGNLTAIVQP